MDSWRLCLDLMDCGCPEQRLIVASSRYWRQQVAGLKPKWCCWHLRLTRNLAKRQQQVDWPLLILVQCAFRKEEWDGSTTSRDWMVPKTRCVVVDRPWLMKEWRLLLKKEGFSCTFILIRLDASLKNARLAYKSRWIDCSLKSMSIRSLFGFSFPHNFT